MLKLLQKINEVQVPSVEKNSKTLCHWLHKLYFLQEEIQSGSEANAFQVTIAIICCFFSLLLLRSQNDRQEACAFSAY